MVASCLQMVNFDLVPKRTQPKRSGQPPSVTPDYRSLVTQTSGMDICQIGYDICEFDSLRGLGIVIIGR